MNISKKYKQYRKAGIALNSKITEKVFDNEALDNAVNLMGFEKQGKTIVFESEFEMDVLQDFLIFESMYEGKRAVEKYQEEHSIGSKIEEEILESLIKAHTSFFKIEAIDKDKNTVWLSDVLSGEQNIRLIDVGLSRSAKDELFIFTRLICFKDFCMTSGASFLFNSSVATYVQRRHRKIMKKLGSHSDSVKRFMAFFKLNRECGLKVINQ